MWREFDHGNFLYDHNNKTSAPMVDLGSVRSEAEASVELKDL